MVLALLNPLKKVLISISTRQARKSVVNRIGF
jgi:hypothetical protein